MAQIKTSTQVGRIPAWSKMVKDITPNDVPFVKSLSTESVTGSTFNWVDKSIATGTKPAVAEGGTPADTAATGRTQRTSYTEIFGDIIDVTYTVEMAEQAGGNAVAELVADKIKRIQRWKEQVFLNGQSGSSTETNRLTKSAQAQIDASLNVDKAGATMTKAFLDTQLELAYTAGADIDTVYCEPSMKRKLTGLLTFAAVVREAGQGKVVTDSVDIYQSDFGDINIIMDRHILSGDILLADSSMWAACELVPMKVEDLAKTTLATRKMVSTEVGLKHKNYLGSALIHNVV